MPADISCYQRDMLTRKTSATFFWRINRHVGEGSDISDSSADVSNQSALGVQEMWNPVA